jgi:molybdopterin molybdotransferase
MAQLSDDCFAFGGELMSLDDALALIRERLEPVTATETIPLIEADGRVLAQDLVAPVALPPFANSAVDGYAVRHRDLAQAADTTLPVRGRIAAGAEAEASSGESIAIRIFTGAPMPDGFDTVFMQEDVVVEGENVVLPPGLKPGANARPAGEDIDRGEMALFAGHRLTPRDLALLGALGQAQVSVREPLRVAVFSTGDELVAPGESLDPAKLYDANRFMLMALLARLSCRVTDLGILPDRRETVTEALREAARAHDLIITSGGVSTGEEDHVKAAVEAGGSLTFWRIAIKPGRPVALGLVAGTPFIGLPGNPAAVYVTFVNVARAIVARLSGETPAALTRYPARSTFSYRKKEGRREYVRARLAIDESGALTVAKYEREGAGVITSLTGTDGLVELPESVTRVAAGDVLSFIPYAALE